MSAEVFCREAIRRPLTIEDDATRKDGALPTRKGGDFADRFYPSSKTCSDCGHVLDALPLSIREWTCPACGVQHDRDINAAVNLKNLAVRSNSSKSSGLKSRPGSCPCAPVA